MTAPGETCTRCRSALEPGAAFCGNCGTPVDSSPSRDGAEPATAAAGVTPQPAPTPPPAPKPAAAPTAQFGADQNGFAGAPSAPPFTGARASTQYLPSASARPPVRLHPPEIIAAVAAVILVIASFLDQYGYTGYSAGTFNAWHRPLLATLFAGYFAGIAAAVAVLPGVKDALARKRLGPPFALGVSAVVVLTFFGEVVSLSGEVHAAVGLILALISSVAIAGALGWQFATDAGLVAAAPRAAAPAAPAEPAEPVAPVAHQWISVTRPVGLYNDGGAVTTVLQPGTFYRSAGHTASGVRVLLDSGASGYVRETDAIV